MSAGADFAGLEGAATAEEEGTGPGWLHQRSSPLRNLQAQNTPRPALSARATCAWCSLLSPEEQRRADAFPCMDKMEDELYPVKEEAVLILDSETFGSEGS